MTQRITFTIDTDASYTDAEKVDLLEAFLEFMREADEDVVEDSENVEFGDSISSSVTEKQKQEVIEEFLGKITLSASIMLDGEEIAVSAND